jgi:cytoskeletal protein CcmA (bactofilin family)
MSEENKNETPADLDADQDLDDSNRARRGGLFGRFNQRFNEALQSGRAPEREREPVPQTTGRPEPLPDDAAIRRARPVSPARMIIPEGATIEGSLTGAADTEISGRIDGNVTVQGRLHLGSSALVSGNVRASSCIIEGLVEGKVECSEDVELGKTGRLNADVMAAKRIIVAGQVYGNIATPGALRLVASCMVNGDVRTRRLMIEEGATFNGRCSMRPPAQQVAAPGSAPPPSAKV